MPRQENDPEGRWSESDSAHFIDYGRYYVPAREEQIAALCDLVPDLDGAPWIVELCCGEGLLTKALLARSPAARLLALDGSRAMLDSTRRTAGDLGRRLETRRFELADRGWRHFEGPVRAVVSSLAVHHLDEAGKRALFADMARALAPGGALVLADLVEPATALGTALAASTWDDAVRRRAREIDGHEAAFTRFQAEHWNYYSDPEPDPVDQPSRLFDQLRWLDEAGFEAVDVHWMKAGHAIYGGRTPARSPD